MGSEMCIRDSLFPASRSLPWTCDSICVPQNLTELRYLFVVRRAWHPCREQRYGIATTGHDCHLGPGAGATQRGTFAIRLSERTRSGRAMAGQDTLYTPARQPVAQPRVRADGFQRSRGGARRRSEDRRPPPAALEKGNDEKYRLRPSAAGNPNRGGPAPRRVRSSHAARRPVARPVSIGARPPCRPRPQFFGQCASRNLALLPLPARRECAGPVGGIHRGAHLRFDD